MPLQKKILVIIVNWNNASDACACLDSVRAQTYTDFDTLVIDNASKSEDFKQLQSYCEQYPSIELQQNTDNLGFTRAINQALKQSKEYEFIALLNNDATAEPSWLEQLVSVAQQKPGNLITSQILQYETPDYIDSVGLYLLDTGEVLPRGHGARAKIYQKPQIVLGPSGTASLYPQEIFDQIGLFDEAFPMGYEDAEFALRAFTRGIKTYYEPTAIAKHKGSVSLDTIKSTDFLVKTQFEIWKVFLIYTPTFALCWSLPIVLIRTLLVFLAWFCTLQWKSIWIWMRAFVWICKYVPKLHTLRKQAQKMRTISSLHFMQQQKFFLSSDLARAWRRIRGKKKQYFS